MCTNYLQAINQDLGFLIKSFNSLFSAAYTLCKFTLPFLFDAFSFSSFFYCRTFFGVPTFFFLVSLFTESIVEFTMSALWWKDFSPSLRHGLKGFSDEILCFFPLVHGAERNQLAWLKDGCEPFCARRFPLKTLPSSFAEWDGFSIHLGRSNATKKSQILLITTESF